MKLFILKASLMILLSTLHSTLSDGQIRCPELFQCVLVKLGGHPGTCKGQQIVPPNLIQQCRSHDHLRVCEDSYLPCRTNISRQNSVTRRQ